MRTKVNSNESFTTLLNDVKNTTLEAYAHQEVPFEKVVEAVVTERDLSRNPLFQVTFIVQNTPDVPELRLGDIQLSVDDHEHGTSKFDITFSITETENGLDGIIEYNKALYTQQTIELMSMHFVTLLQSVVNTPGEKISNLKLLTPWEEEALIVGFNNNEVDYPKDKSIVDLFEEQVLKTPRRIAVEFGDSSITYAALNEKANQLSSYLQQQGITKEVLVPICIERSAEMIIGILGILKAGGGYVPIDPQYPLDRIRYMLEDTGSKLVVTSEECRSKLETITGTVILDLNNDWTTISSQSFSDLSNKTEVGQAAYVIYTSGSTGKPKGVVIEHCSVVNLIHAQTEYFSISADERILQFSNYSFDASVEQIFLTLFNGATLVLFPEGLQYHTLLFEDFLREKKITHLHATPFFLENINEGNYPELKRMIAGGDICRKELVMKWKDKVDFYNEYGPTETTVTSIEYHVDTDSIIDNFVPIGKPLANVPVYILDKNGGLCPAGVPGEMHIGGVQVARGYLNRPELTEEKFIPDPFSKISGVRLYKTGDLARWLNNGNLEFLGRIDDQVKLQGYRIELGEIETVLNSLEPVENSCVVVKEVAGGTNRLVAYYVPKTTVIKEKEHELYIEQVNTWKEIHDNEYILAEEENNTDEEFDILGWNDSFTRKQIPEEQMREWLTDIIDVIVAEEPGVVLEIGSGTGLIYYPLAGKVRKYIGTDFSANSIGKISTRISKGLRDYGPTELQVCAAHDISLKENEKVDTVIINSVVQYFPGGDYLTTVVEKSLSLLKGEGRIIIGDVRDNRTLELFKTRLHLAKLQETAKHP
jgi:amino acid adenylation domain-containing protein